ncbi:hypothetical protein LJR290_007799 [Variovorax sp. LjRoot290]
MLIGLFGAVRNPTAHAPKTVWPMPEQDAMEILRVCTCRPSQAGHGHKV